MDGSGLGAGLLIAAGILCAAIFLVRADGAKNSATSRSSATSSARPVPVAGQAAERAAGGSMWSWGWNHAGQLGDGTAVDRAKPAKVSGLQGLTTVVSLGTSVYGLSADGTVWVWGSDTQYIAHQSDTRPTSVPGLEHRAKLLFASGDNAFVVDQSGRVWSWGSNRHGELGTGEVRDQCWRPAVVPGPSGVVSIACTSWLLSGSTVYALTDHGTVWTWGQWVGWRREATPVQVPELAGVVSISADPYCGYAVRSDGSAWRINSGRVEQVAGLTGVTAMVSDRSSAYALTSDGFVWTRGGNQCDQLDGGSCADHHHGPIKVMNLERVHRLETNGNGSFYALTQDGTVWAWGANHFGQLGDGTTDARDSPVMVKGLSRITNLAVDSFLSAFALDSDGDVWSWGSNEYGQLGYRAGGSRAVAERVPGLTNVSAIATESGSVFALKA